MIGTSLSAQADGSRNLPWLTGASAQPLGLCVGVPRSLSAITMICRAPSAEARGADGLPSVDADSPRPPPTERGHLRRRRDCSDRCSFIGTHHLPMRLATQPSDRRVEARSRILLSQTSSRVKAWQVSAPGGVDGIASRWLIAIITGRFAKKPSSCRSTGGDGFDESARAEGFDGARSLVCRLSRSNTFRVQRGFR